MCKNNNDGTYTFKFKFHRDSINIKRYALFFNGSGTFKFHCDSINMSSQKKENSNIHYLNSTVILLISMDFSPDAAVFAHLNSTVILLIFSH